MTGNKNNLVLLKKESFNLLGKLIKESILDCLKANETQRILEDIVLLIKSTKYFGFSQENTKIKLYDEYKTFIQENPKIIQENFWQKWYDVDIKSIENPDDKMKQEIIYNICDSLIDLEVSKTMVKNITDHITQKAFGKDTPLHKETFKVFIKKIINAKYFSKSN